MEEHAGLIVKGKRTKRLRPQSPVPFEVADSSPTTATSSAEIFSSITEEEEETANCLILLAQGHEYQKPAQLSAESNRDEAAAASPKFTSRRYLETATSTGSRAGYYVYQCKTCNRTFPSFQALGGHRASHKKPKNTTNNHINISSSSSRFTDSLALPSPTSAEKKQIFTLLPSSSDDEDGQFRKFSSLSFQMGSNDVGFGNNNNVKNGNGSSSKVHECSICGAEFTSGQALGGHMRRHRATPIGISIPNAIPSSAGAIATLSLTPLVTFEDLEEPPLLTPGPNQAKVSNLSLDLDLNLPASAQDHQGDHRHHHQADHRESCGPSEFQSLMKPSPSSSSSQQQVEQKSQPANKSSMVFSSSPSLVGCHY